MSRFGTKKINTTKTINYAGGESYKQSPELELASILLTSFTKDKFYRTADDEINRLKQLVKVVDPELACKAAVYTRQIAGMRSISHVLTAEVAPLISGKDYSRNFYNAVVRRPDDMLEVLSYGKANNWAYKTLPKAMERGFKDALGKFDGYQLAKWRKENNQINLVNILHLVHPKPNSVLNDLYKNRLKTKGTRESMLAETGQIENRSTMTAERVAEVRAENLEAGWKNLLSEKKIGYKALVGSLVKVINEAPQMIDVVCEILADYTRIRKSLIMPSEIIVAYEQVAKLSNSNARKVIMALDLALNYSVENAPKFRGKTLVVLDESGSMRGKPSLIGSLFAAVLCKANACDLMTFADRARYRSYNPSDSVGTIARSITFSSGGTNFRSIFTTANGGYDRVVILSDMQNWVGHNSGIQSYQDYCKKYNVTPYLYSFDLNGYGSTQFPSNKIITISGFSNSVFDMMKNAEESELILLDRIKRIKFEDYIDKNK